MVGAFGTTAALAAARERPDEDGGFGVAGQAEGVFRTGRTPLDLRQVLKDGLGLLHFFSTIRNRAKMTAIPGSAAPGRQGGPAVASSIGPSSCSCGGPTPQSGTAARGPSDTATGRPP